MINNVICFFSSDARSLYLEDIYRALALPKKSILHFRYQQKYVDDTIVKNLKKENSISYLKKEGVIFFVTGNRLTTEENQVKAYHSIRKVLIRDCYISDNTNLVHFYLELGDFFDYKIDDTYPHEKFVAFVPLSEENNHKWIDIVKKVEPYFEETLFFHYEIFNHQGIVVQPTYNKVLKDSIFNIEDESEYIINCSFYDMRQGTSSLSYEDDDILTIYYKESTKLSALVDDRQYKIVTRSINQKITPQKLKFFPKTENSNEEKFEVQSFFCIKKRNRSISCFGFWTSLALLALILAQQLSLVLKKCFFHFSLFVSFLIIVLFLALLYVFGLSASKLYSHFNKK